MPVHLEPVRLDLDVAGVAVAIDPALPKLVIDLEFRVNDAADVRPLLIEIAVAPVDAAVRTDDQLRGPAERFLLKPLVASAVVLHGPVHLPVMDAEELLGPEIDTLPLCVLLG